jgi:hypothetical protein
MTLVSLLGYGKKNFEGTEFTEASSSFILLTGR